MDMTDQVAPPKATGGWGFTYEDRVGANWTLRLLAGSAPLDPELGAPVRLRFQARFAGWSLDDLVAEFSTSGGTARAAASVKSGRVIKGFRAPGGFVKACWQRYLSAEGEDFDPTRDRLLLITRDLTAQQRDTFALAIQLAAHDPEGFDRKVSARRFVGKSVRVFAQSFRIPPILRAACPRVKRCVGPLLQAVRIIDLDFEPPIQEAESRAIDLARDVVESGGLEEAWSLWRALLVIISIERPTAGVVDLLSLLRRLRGVVRLKAHPDYRPDWERLARRSSLWLQQTRDTIGPTFRAGREKCLGNLEKELGANRVVVLLGESGAGKSVLVKRLIQTGHMQGPTYCLHADEIADPKSAPTSQHLHEVLNTQPAPSARLVIDGMDRVVGETAFRRVADVIRALELGSEGSPWRLILTCQHHAWPSARGHLRSFNAALEEEREVWVEGLDGQDLLALRKAEPCLQHVLSRGELRPLISRPKVLDLLHGVTGFKDGPGPKALVGESSLIEMYWDGLVMGQGRGPRHAAALQEFARALADDGRFGTPLAHVDPAGVDALLELRGPGILRLQDDVVQFVHDLDADYARQRYLLSLFRSGRAEEIRERIMNPRWHRAVRLLGLHLLEAGGGSGADRLAAWADLARAIGDGDPSTGVGVDLLLEAAAFSPEAERILNVMRELLFASDGRLLRRLLGRLLCALTIPNQSLLDAFPDATSADRQKFEAAWRLPLYHLWGPVVGWLVANKGEALRLAAKEIVEAGYLWFSLKSPPGVLPFDREFADMIFDLEEAEDLDREEREQLHLTFILCADRDKKRFDSIALRLAGLSPPAGDGETTGSGKRRRAKRRSIPGDEILGQDQPWPLGPSEDPDEGYQNVALARPGADLLVQMDPPLAARIFLGLLIEPPRVRTTWDSPHRLDRSFCLQRVKAARPPFHDFAPARQLLERDPERGLEFVVGLVDFATDRWAEEWRTTMKEDGEPEDAWTEVPSIILTVDGVPKPFVGNKQVLNWHRGAAIGPDAVAASLMALEAWLYSHAEKGDIDVEHLRFLLRRARSLAVVGVLAELALKHADLLAGPLEPLVEPFQIYLASRIRSIDDPANAAMIPWTFEPAARVQVATNWHGLPHRRLEFMTVVVEVFARSKGKWTALEAARQHWVEIRKRPEVARYGEFLDALIAQFDPANWKFTETAVGGLKCEFRPPTEMLARSNASEDEGVRRLSIAMLPARCRRILDGKEAIAEGALPDLLQLAEQVREDQQEVRAFGAASVRCGVAAVTMMKFPAWLEREAAWGTKCREWILQSCELVARGHPFRRREEISGWSWDAFCAEVVPRLWESDPGCPRIRRALAHLVAAPNNGAVARLFIALASRRRVDPAGFFGLLHLGVRYARLAALANPDAYTPVPVGPAMGAFAKLVESFLAGTLGELPGDWAKYACEVEGIHSPEVEPRRLPSGFHEVYLLHEMAWLFDEASKVEAEDRKFLVGIVESIGALLVGRLNGSIKVENGRRRRVNGGPYQFDDKIAALCAIFVAHERTLEARRRLWRPWMDLPADCDYWIGSFLNAVYEHCLDRRLGGRESMPAVSEIVSYGLSDEGWAGHADSPLYRASATSALLGVGGFIRPAERWTDRRADALQVLTPHLQRYGWLAADSRCEVLPLLRLLGTPAAKRVVAALFEVLGARIPKGWAGDTDSKEALVSLLEWAWQDDRQSLINSKAASEGFGGLLHFLVGEQVPRAMLLSERVAGGRVQ